MPPTLATRPLGLAGLVLLAPRVFRDARGFLFESYNQRAFAEAGIRCAFVQDNHSCSVRHTLRGMHFQRRPGQDKLIAVASGEVFDVAVDVRPDSPTFGQWRGVTLSAAEPELLFIPAGFAHGFCVLSESAHLVYKLSTPYDPALEGSFRWDDPEVAIAWPIRNPILSDRDRVAGPFAALRAEAAR